MRGMSGPQVVSRLTVSQPRLRAVFRVRIHQKTDLRARVGQGEDSLLQKPFTRSSLLQVVHGALKEQAFPGGITKHG